MALVIHVHFFTACPCSGTTVGHTVLACAYVYTHTLCSGLVGLTWSDLSSLGEPSPFLHAHLCPTEGRLGYSFLFMSYISICGSGEPLWVMQGGSRCRFLWACLPGSGESHLLPHSSPIHLPFHDCQSLPAIALGLSSLPLLGP